MAADTETQTIETRRRGSTGACHAGQTSVTRQRRRRSARLGRAQYPDTVKLTAGRSSHTTILIARGKSIWRAFASPVSIPELNPPISSATWFQVIPRSRRAALTAACSAGTSQRRRRSGGGWGKELVGSRRCGVVRYEALGRPIEPQQHL